MVFFFRFERTHTDFHCVCQLFSGTGPVFVFCRSVLHVVVDDDHHDDDQTHDDDDRA